MYGIFAYVWLIFMINAGKLPYTECLGKLQPHKPHLFLGGAKKVQIEDFEVCWYMGYLLASLKTKTGPFNQKETDRFFFTVFQG